MKKLIPFEYRLPIIYIVFGVLWILFSDDLVVSFTSDVHQIHIISTFKGWFYVLVTGVLLFILIKREVKRRNNLYYQLLEASRKASESDKLKSAFLSNLSHYIRTPMNSILGFVELISDNPADKENNQVFLNIINEQSQHLLQTLGNIIEVSKIQEGQTTLQMSNVPISEIMLAQVEHAKNEILKQKKTIRILVEFNSNVSDLNINSDQEKLSLILANYINNAVTFTKSGDIAVGCYIENKDVVFYVKDTGCGVSDEKISSLFTGFMFNSEYSYSIGEGPSIGLYLSGGLAKLLGGRVWLKETSPNGSTFCLSIPLQ